MVIFEKIRYKNILSTGDVWTEIDLESYGTTLIMGENGAGKSTILDALSFALYGKPFRRIRKPQLVNSYNKSSLEIELWFRIGNRKFLVRRGIKPNIFEIWIDDIMVDQSAATKDYQAYLENDILKMNHKSFGQIVVLGSSTFVPFMSLPAQHRREVIEDLLDIQIFSTMNDLVKGKLTDLKEGLLENKYQIEMLEAKKETIEKHSLSVQAIKNQSIKSIKAKMKELIASIEGSRAEKFQKIAIIEGMKHEIVPKSALKKTLERHRLDAQMLASEIASARVEIDFLKDNDTCTRCNQGIPHDHKLAEIETLESMIEEKSKAEADIRDDLATIERDLFRIGEVEETIQSLTIDANALNAKIEGDKQRLVELKGELEGLNKTVEETDSLDEVIRELTLKQTAKKDMIDKRDTLTIVASMLKDGGIKTQIIKQYVPIMNKLINKYLASMDFFVDFRLDEQFNETILSRFRDDFSYASFSEGEKLRIDLALLMTWKSIAKIRNSVSTNLLILDEIMDSSLDASGLDEFMKILNELTGSNNTIIISHKTDLIYDKFDRTIKFEKVKNFSEVVTT